MAIARDHTFQILTKRPARMRDFIVKQQEVWKRLGPETGRPLPNVWLGVSVEDQATADERIPLLLQTPAAKRFVSYEPALAAVDFRPYVTQLDVLCCPHCGFRTNRQGHGPCPNDGAPLGPDIRLDQIIVGGESGPGARCCEVAWLRSTVRQCRAAGVAAFVKQVGANVIDRNDAGFEGDTPTSWPMDTRVEHLTHQNWQGDPVRVRLRNSKGGRMEEWPADLRVREMPA